MKLNEKHPFYTWEIVNIILGIIILVLVILIFSMEEYTELLSIASLVLAGIMHFISAVIGFAGSHRLRGYICSGLSASFLIMAIVLGSRLFL